MGSSGSGRFGSYSETESKACPAKFVVDIEDFDTNEYFLSYSKLPNLGDKVEVDNELVNKRLVLTDLTSGFILGNVPIEYNYIYNRCIEKGKKYSGTIIHTFSNPVNKILVELNLE